MQRCLFGVFVSLFIARENISDVLVCCNRPTSSLEWCFSVRGLSEKQTDFLIFIYLHDLNSPMKIFEYVEFLSSRNDVSVDVGEVI